MNINFLLLKSSSLHIFINLHRVFFLEWLVEIVIFVFAFIFPNLCNFNLQLTRYINTKLKQKSYFYNVLYNLT